MLWFEVLARNFSHEWLQETVSLVIPNAMPREGFTIVHLAAKGGLFRLLHEVFLDKYDFDVDFYRPQCRLTLLHVVAKYGSGADWGSTR